MDFYNADRERINNLHREEDELPVYRYFAKWTFSQFKNEIINACLKNNFVGKFLIPFPNDLKIIAGK